MFGLGLPELIVIFFVILLLFGAKSLPEIAKGLGQAIKIFKKESEGINEELKSTSQDSEISSASDQKNETKENNNNPSV